MSVRRSLHLENTPLKIPALERTFSPYTGTRVISPGPSTKGKRQTRRQTMTDHQSQKAHQKKLETLRDDLKKSVESIQKSKQVLESYLPLEGSSELDRLFPRGPGDLLSELEKHRELVAKVESGLAMASVDRRGHITGLPPAANSYQFLRDLLK